MSSLVVLLLSPLLAFLHCPLQSSALGGHVSIFRAFYLFLPFTPKFNIEGDGTLLK